jgi:hypothetical protein
VTRLSENILPGTLGRSPGNTVPEPPGTRAKQGRTCLRLKTCLALVAVPLVAACGTATSHATKANVPHHSAPTSPTTTSTQGASASSIAPPATGKVPTSSPPNPGAASSPLPTVTIGTWTGVRPNYIYFTQDGGNIVGQITWTSWSEQSAMGTGVWKYNPCTPSCAMGTVQSYPATIELGSVSNGQFTSLTEIQTGPHGATMHFSLPDPTLSAS